MPTNANAVLVRHERGSGDHLRHRDRDGGTSAPATRARGAGSAASRRSPGPGRGLAATSHRGRLAARAARRRSRADVEFGQRRLVVSTRGASSSSSCQASALRGSSAGRKGSSSAGARWTNRWLEGISGDIARWRVAAGHRVTGRYGSYGAIGRAAGGNGRASGRRAPVRYPDRQNRRHGDRSRDHAGTSLPFLPDARGARVPPTDVVTQISG